MVVAAAVVVVTWRGFRVGNLWRVGDLERWGWVVREGLL